MPHLSGFMALLLFFSATALGQELGQEAGTPELAPTPAPQRSEPLLTVERVEALRKEAAESNELDAEAKKKVAEIYRSALAELQRATELTARTAAFTADAEAVGQRLAQIRQQLGELKGKEPVPLEAGTLAELELANSKLELQQAALRKAQAAAEAEPISRGQRRKDVRSRLVAISERRAELQKQTESLPPDEHALLTAARRTELAARQLAMEHEAPALEKELTKYDAEDAADLVRFQRDLCTQEVALAERRLLMLKEQINKVRTAAAEQAVRKARDEAIAADPVLESYAQRNRELAESGKSIAQKYDATDKELKSAQEAFDQLFRQFEQSHGKVESVGLTSSIGALLRKQQAALPDVRKRRAAVHSREETINKTQYELFEYDDERKELANPELLVQRILAKAGGRNPLDLAMLEEAARDVLDRKREYLDALIRHYNKYFDTLVELDTTDQQIMMLAQQYQQYIDERVLWIRSGNVLTSQMQLDQSDAWFISAEQWLVIPRRLWSDFATAPVPYGLAVLLLTISSVRGRYFRRELREIGEMVQRPTCRQFRVTLRAVALTIVIAAVWPGLIGFVAWRLNLAANGAPFAKAVAHGLFCLCAMWFPLELFRHICRSRGLAESHFGWPRSATQLLRRQLPWLILLGLPLTFVTSTFFASDPTHGRDAIERTCFILEAMVLAAFLRRVFHPVSGVLSEYIAYHQDGWIDRLKYVWYCLGVAAPMVLAGLAFWGYYYTAQVLSWRLHATICFVVALVLVRALLLRLILLRRRILSMEQARERAAAAAQSNDANVSLPTAGIATEQAQADLSTHSVQTQRLLSTGTLATSLVGFWLIWIGVLPALSMLDKWPLWSTTTSVQVVEQRDSPPAGPMRAMASQSPANQTMRTEYQKTSITFSDVALALLIAIITFLSARDVPGLLEMSVLQRLPLDASVRYAITTLVSYGILLLGVIVACSTIGLRWSQIQWLATALTFGLAFGLQEMFANFVAGLIILFERPVRVGDIVTVDDVTGIVSRIRIRATSITNWDRKEYVVPNKEFITGRLLNWTLSDKVNRVVISVGVQYGTDTEKARELLLNVANQHPLILKDPPSLATFEGFGDNSLSLTLRTFLPNMENRLQVIHELHTTIDKTFREAGIQIAFPQRDLHIRAMPESLVLSPAESLSHGQARPEAA